MALMRTGICYQEIESKKHLLLSKSTGVRKLVE